MTPNFDSRNNSQPLSSSDASTDYGSSASQPDTLLDNLKRDRFELLSAYLDGEVTASERRQVEHWLDTDPAVQQLYSRLLKLRQAIRTMPVPTAEQPAEQVTQRVFNQINRRQRFAMAWGGVAIAAVFVGVFSSFTPSFQTPSQQFAAEQPASPDTTASNVSSDALMIALDQPLIEIPKATISEPVDPSQLMLYESQTDIR
ncbi:zf-HC2 domain-containing protein [Oscillatoria sp. FACHB-1407]|uniref:anti-sigma factor family protein n=1 Tax=Oscillatoria sp. FACHB-1407 TaxID=2692847 RepID=UPI0016821FEA|nr:zf-HC2 domain-containing protein [Oscillatoria sp. FACHB-1407]MBD2460869.1 zf-HC2 domain-containing protein [Oscillatoria sp. FACHB-1407]